MPILAEFGSEIDPHLEFPHPFVDRPRLPNGLRHIDVGPDNANVRIKTTVKNITKTSADCSVSVWSDTTLYGGLAHALVLAPADVDFLTGSYLRTFKDPAFVHVDFECPFVTPPKVVVFLNYIELDKNGAWRLQTTATNINKKGFKLGIEALGDTFIYAVQACWIAYPEDREHIYSTSVNTLDIRPSNKITFKNVELLQNPAVFVALNAIDIDNCADLRVRAYVDDVSTNSLTWHIGTWDDTILYSAGASIIAFNP